MLRPVLIFLILSFIPYSTFCKPVSITNVVVFGDSLSDRGFTKEQGGFNRYSNGPVWPEYFTSDLCKTCLQVYAWGGAKSDQTNVNNLDWSGLLWQVEHYRMTTNPEHTLYIIWVGANDLIQGETNGAIPPTNIMLAMDQLIDKGARYIAVFNLPDFSLVPAYNDPQLPEYNEYSPIKGRVKQELKTYNQTLKTLLKQKKKDYSGDAPGVTIYSVDFSDFFNKLIRRYNNKQSPWLGTYDYPEKNGYFWWDHWHPMTSVHQQIAKHVKQSLEQQALILGSELLSPTGDKRA